MNTTEADVHRDGSGDEESTTSPAVHDQERNGGPSTGSGREGDGSGREGDGSGRGGDGPSENGSEPQKAPAITTPNAIAGAPADTDPDAETEQIAGSQTRLLDSGP